jgi:U3 small nucleolar RNA-associated protein 12
MVKIYKRYKESSSFGVITSGLILEKEGECITNALSDVVSWNVKQSTSRKLYQHDKLITSMAKSKSIIAIGYEFFIYLFELIFRYADGSIRLLGNEMVVLNGHRSAVTALCFNSTGTRLASGSSDTDVVLWDVISEEGLCRLKGHKDQVTCIQFIGKQYLILYS